MCVYSVWFPIYFQLCDQCVFEFCFHFSNGTGVLSSMEESIIVKTVPIKLEFH